MILRHIDLRKPEATLGVRGIAANRLALQVLQKDRGARQQGGVGVCNDAGDHALANILGLSSGGANSAVDVPLPATPTATNATIKQAPSFALLKITLPPHPPRRGRLLRRYRHPPSPTQGLYSNDLILGATLRASNNIALFRFVQFNIQYILALRAGGHCLLLSFRKL